MCHAINTSGNKLDSRNDAIKGRGNEFIRTAYISGSLLACIPNRYNFRRDVPALLNIGILFHLSRLQWNKLFSWLATRGFFEKIASHNEREWQAPNLSPRVIYVYVTVPRGIIARPRLIVTSHVKSCRSQREGSISKKGPHDPACRALAERKVHGNFNRLKFLQRPTTSREIAPADARVWRMYAYLFSKSRDDL